MSLVCSVLVHKGGVRLFFKPKHTPMFTALNEKLLSGGTNPGVTYFKTNGMLRAHLQEGTAQPVANALSLYLS